MIKKKIDVDLSKQISADNMTSDLKKESKNKINSLNNLDYKMINPIFNNMTKFKLQNGTSKFPSAEWKRSNWSNLKTTAHKDFYSHGGTYHDHLNWGLPCGKKNGVILLDLDIYKWQEDHPFYELAARDEIEDYLYNLKTITVRTGHNGWHLWFKWTDKIRTRDNGAVNIDIKSDGGYGVGPGSKMIKEKGKAPEDEVGKIGYYREIWRDTHNELREIPDDLIAWLNKYQQPSMSGRKRPTGAPKNQSIINAGDQEGNQYNYNINDEKLIEIINKLPKELWTDFNEWFKLTTAFKALNRKDVWDAECKKHKGYNKYKNDKIWNGITGHNNLNIVNWMLHATGDRTLLDYIKYKPIPHNELKKLGFNYETISRKKLGKMEDEGFEDDYVKLDKYKDVFIRSDTATGKTTLLKKYIYNTNKPVISIVSRVSLADSHYHDFQEIGINIHNYHIAQDRWWFKTGDSVVVTIESIKRITDLDFSNYVVFLDEYDSLIKHLIKSPTLNNKRTYSWKVLRRLIKECDQVVAVDADIHSNRMKFINGLDRQISIIENSYKHNQGIKMREVYNYNDFINNLMKVEDKLVCCDSKTDAEIVFKEIVKRKHAKPINKEDSEITSEDPDGEKKKINKIQYQLYKDADGKTYALITSDTDEYVKLDNYDIVVFSPKIIYGLDSIRERPVYAHYKEHTINPRAMLQQVARCRNIVELVYIFYKKKFNDEVYGSIVDVKEEYKKLKEYTRDFNELLTEEESGLYEEMLIDLEYEEDCYSTNKYAHFRTGGLEKGFIEEIKAIQTSQSELLEVEKKHQEDKELFFNPDDPVHDKINKYLDLPKEIMTENKDLFIKTQELNKYFNRATFFFKGEYEWQDDIKNGEEFIVNKVRSNKNKYKYLLKVFNELGIEDKTIIKPSKKINKTKADELWKEYKALWRDRGEQPDLTIAYQQTKWICGIYRKMFGGEMVLTKRENIGGKKLNQYSISADKLYDQRDLMIYKDPLIPKGDLDFKIGYEHEILRDRLVKNHRKEYKKSLNIIRLIKGNIKTLKSFNETVDSLDL